MCYTLGLENNPFFGYTVEKFLDALSDKNISHSMYYTKNDKKVILKIFLNDEKKEIISELITDYIIENYCKKKALKLIDKNYHYFNEFEIKDILERIFQKNEREKIKNLVYEYILSNDHLYPEGFAAFRLGEFFECMDDSIGMIVDEMLLNKEYLEFVKILRQFVSLNDSEVFAVNIYKPCHGRYILLDENNKKISGEFNEITFEIAEEELSIQDMLLSDLVSLSPKRIIVHNKENFEDPELLKTLEMVFEGALTYCCGCKSCEKYFQKR